MKNKFIFTSTLSIVRLLLGLCFILTMLFNSIHDLIPEQYFHEVVMKNSNKINFFTHFSYNNIHIPFIISFIILLTSVIGIYPRILCILHSWVSFSLFSTFAVIEGGDQLSFILLIPIFIFDDRIFSWRGEKVVRNDKSTFVIYVFLTVIKLQISFVYLQAAIDKFFVPEWYNGTACYYWLNHNIFGPIDELKKILNIFLSNKYFCSTLTWSIMLTEVFIAFSFLGNSRIKYIAFILGFVLHFSFFFFLGLPTFMLVMYAALMLYTFKLNKSFVLNLKNLLKWKKLFQLEN